MSPSSCNSSAPTCFCRLLSCICYITAKFALKFTDFSMKKFSVILQYLSRYKGKIVVYMIFNILSIVFGLLSVGMLSPFLLILFQNEGGKGQSAMLNTNAIGGLKDVLAHVIQHNDQNIVLLVI